MTQRTQQDGKGVKKFPEGFYWGEPVRGAGARLIVSFHEPVRYKRSNELKQYTMLFQKIVSYFEKITTICTASVRWTVSVRDGDTI